MQNVTAHVKDNGKKLVIEVDLTQDLGPSSSGKTNIIATTSGFVSVPVDGVSFGLNVVKKVKPQAQKGA